MGILPWFCLRDGEEGDEKAAVAADLETRMRKKQGEEVAAILKRLPERTVAEVLEAMPDPATRNEIYDLMRTPVALKSEVQGEAR